MNLRYFLYAFAFLFIPAIYIATDPTHGIIKDLPIGAEILGYYISLSRVAIALVLLHLARRVLHNYPSAKLENLLKTALSSPVGAGLGVVGLGLFMIAYALMTIAILSPRF